jgi:hypothetical protein
MTPTNQARDEAARIDMESVQRARAWVRSMYEGNPITPIQPDYAFLAGWDARDKVAKEREAKLWAMLRKANEIIWCQTHTSVKDGVKDVCKKCKWLSEYDDLANLRAEMGG